MTVGRPFNPDSMNRTEPASMGKRAKKPLSEKLNDPKLIPGLTGEDALLKKTLANITPGKMIATSLIIGILGYLYISHVFYMQRLHTEVLRLRTQYEQVRLDQHNTQLTYERLTGPADVYQRARQIGLIDGGPADNLITRNP
jgi:hypothetical protein